MAPALAWIPILIGVAVLAGTAISVMRTLVVPRGLVPRLSFNTDRLLRRLFRWLAAVVPGYEAKDAVLSYEGPVRLMGLLVSWLVTTLVGYAFLYWPFVDSLGDALRSAGSAMFTLGFVGESAAVPIAITFFAAASGLVLVALQISYLPTIYAAFNRRETLVTMLSSRTGQPPWGPEVLARHALINNLDDLPQFFRDWEGWAADLAETHTNYPVLVAFRAPHPMRHWIVALNAVMDAAAMYLALAPRRAPSQANAFLRMGYTSLRELALLFRIDFDPDPLPDDPIDLSFDEFREGVALLDDAGFPRERTPAEAWPHFHGWRVNYESLVYAIADRLVAPPGLWTGPRRNLPGVTYAPERPQHRHPEDEEASAG